jgi:hypothetical protein
MPGRFATLNLTTKSHWTYHRRLGQMPPVPSESSEVGRKPRCMRWSRSPFSLRRNIAGFSRLASWPKQSGHVMTANRRAVHDGIQNEGRPYRMGERSNHVGKRGLLQRAAGREASQKFESRDMAVTRIWTAVSRDKPTWRGSLRRAARGNSPRLGRLRNPVADLMLTPSETARMGSMMG